MSRMLKASCGFGRDRCSVIAGRRAGRARAKNRFARPGADHRPGRDQKCTSMGFKTSAAVVDRGGNLIVLLHGDGADLHQ